MELNELIKKLKECTSSLDFYKFKDEIIEKLEEKKKVK